VIYVFEDDSLIRPGRDILPFHPSSCPSGSLISGPPCVHRFIMCAVPFGSLLLLVPCF